VNVQLAKWREWSERRIRPEIYEIYLHRHISTELTAITKAKELPASYFFTYLAETYATSQMIAVRRQADRHRKVASLAKLMAEIAQAPQTITRDFYVREWGDDLPGHASGAFDSYAAAGDKNADPNRIRQELALLDETVSRVKRYVDQSVAHSDSNAKAMVPTFNDLNAAIDLLGKFYNRYHGLLFPGSSYATLVPVITSHDWKAALRVPWID
jgi:hypothetical protein